MTKPYNQEMISRRQDGAIMEHGYKVLKCIYDVCVCVTAAKPT